MTSESSFYSFSIIEQIKNPLSQSDTLMKFEHYDL
jgi:hypothetical protein